MVVDSLRGLLGLAVLTGFCFLISENRRAVNWRLVGAGLGLQLVLGILVLKVGWVSDALDWVANLFVTFLGFASAGSAFLFGGLVEDVEGLGFIFAFQVLPVLIFFSAVSALLYYLKVLPLLVRGFAWLMGRTMQLSGAESLAASANVFLGQTEAPLLVKPYIEKMTRSELFALMTGGMATIAGSVFGGYVLFLGGDDPAEQALFAKHLLTASILSALAALAVAKLMIPETEAVSAEAEISADETQVGANAFEALTIGTTDGLRLAFNVGAMLLVFISLIALINSFLSGGIGSWTGLNAWLDNFSGGTYEALTLQAIFGYLFAPVAWLIGVDPGSLLMVGQLLGEKLVATEFVAYISLGELKSSGAISDREAIIIATYALCGFSNVASMGIQIGGIAAIAPGRRRDLSELALGSLVAGTVACLCTACVAGMLV